MDKAAAAAEKEFDTILSEGTPSAEDISEVALWWTTHFLNAGHKRLGRLMVRVSSIGVDRGLKPNGHPGDNPLDQAAEAARAAISQRIEEGDMPNDGVKAVADWLKSHYGAAGHKRLGRVLVQHCCDLHGIQNHPAIIRRFIAGPEK